jgi:hypothetical protein
MLETWLKPKLRAKGLIPWGNGHFALSKRSFERTSSTPLDWPWFTDISGAIKKAIT